MLKMKIKYAALLRGIGPGNPNMRGEKLKAFFEGLGFTNVMTLLASGNVIFETAETDKAKLVSLIEMSLPEKLGFTSTAITRSQSELLKVLDDNPYKGREQDHNKDLYFLITFFKQPTDVPFKLPFRPENKPYTVLAKSNAELYGAVDITKGKTPDYMVWLERQFGKNITSRTLKTTQLIVDKMAKI